VGVAVAPHRVEVANETDAARLVLGELERAASYGFAERRTASRRYHLPPPEQLGLGLG
jgi:hypothetical protein